MLGIIARIHPLWRIVLMVGTLPLVFADSIFDRVGGNCYTLANGGTLWGCLTSQQLADDLWQRAALLSMMAIMLAVVGTLALLVGTLEQLFKRHPDFQPNVRFIAQTIEPMVFGMVATTGLIFFI